jgi:hypothetical protein
VRGGYRPALTWAWLDTKELPQFAEGVGEVAAHVGGQSARTRSRASVASWPRRRSASAVTSARCVGRRGGSERVITQPGRPGSGPRWIPSFGPRWSD